MSKPDPTERILADVEVDEGSRFLANQLYQAALADGCSEDEALTMAAEALRKMRDEWDDAKAADDG